MTTPASTRQECTLLLGKWSGGDDGALEKLFPLVQPELHGLILFLLTKASRQPFLELPTSTGEPRHDRSSRNLRDVGYLLVREIFLVSQRQDLTQRRRQFIHCFPN